jgi:hypothetical protein
MRRVTVAVASLVTASCVQIAPPSSISKAGSLAATTQQAQLRSEVEAYDYRGSADPRGALDVRINDGSGERQVPVANLGRGEQARPISTRSTGTLRVSVRFMSNGRALATQDVELPLRPDWRWGLALHVSARNPLEGCFGCLGVRSTLLAGGSAGEKLHVVWGGNSIATPAVY